MSALAIVPAAGRSERFGSPKLVATFEGEPLVARTVRSLLEGHVARVVVVASVTGAFDHIPLLRDPRVAVVVNPNPDRGMFSSIQTGWSAAEGDPVVILPGDMPFVQPATVAAVVAAFRQTPGLVVAQRHARHGHPIALPGSLRAAALAAPATSTLDAFIKSQGLEPIEVEVEDKGVLQDVDTPADLHH